MSTDLDLTTNPTHLDQVERGVAEHMAAAAQPPVLPTDDDLWPTAPPKGLRLGILTLILGGLGVAGLGFAGGAFAYKRQHPVAAVPANTGAAGQGQGQRGQGRTGGGGGAGTGGAPGGAAGGATFGTVKTVDGATVYVTDASGNLVKVTLPDGTTVNATRPATAADIRPGDTVIIQGAKQPDGSTQASTVSVNPQTGGGFQRGGNTATTPGG